MPSRTSIWDLQRSNWQTEDQNGKQTNTRPKENEKKRKQQETIRTTQAKKAWTWESKITCMNYFIVIKERTAFKFQPCDHTPPGTQRLVISHKVLGESSM